MRKVTLRMKEEYKYKMIKKLIETNGNKKRVALMLKCTVRTINRLIITYHTKGKEGLCFKTSADTFNPPFSICLLLVLSSRIRKDNYKE